MKTKRIAKNFVRNAVFSSMLLSCSPAKNDNVDGNAGAISNGGISSNVGSTNSGGKSTGGVSMGGSGNSAGTNESLCDGDTMHKKEYSIGIGERVECESQVVIFTNKTGSGRVTFTITDGDNPMVSSHMTLDVGAKSIQNISDIGETVFELCSIKGETCSYTLSGIVGDASCKAVLASDRMLGQVGECK